MPPASTGASVNVDPDPAADAEDAADADDAGDDDEAEDAEAEAAATGVQGLAPAALRSTQRMPMALASEGKLALLPSNSSRE